MRPTTVTFKPYYKSPLKQSFNQTSSEGDQGNRAVGERAQTPLFVMERLAVMAGTWPPLQVSNPVEATEADWAWERGKLPGYLFSFLTGAELFNEPVRGDASIATDVRKRLQANLLYDRLEYAQVPERLARVQLEDPQLIPTITVGGANALPQYAKYDVVCSTDDAVGAVNARAIAQLCEGLGDSTREIRGLRLEFGFTAVHPAPLKDIKNGVARKHTLEAIELMTNAANTAAETEVFRAIGVNSKIEQLYIHGPLAAGHSRGMITALSNPSLKDVAISADGPSCLHMLDWAAEASGPMTNTKPPAPERTLRLSPSNPKYADERPENLAKWNAAVVRLAESGTTKSLHLPKEIKRFLTPGTRSLRQPGWISWGPAADSEQGRPYLKKGDVMTLGIEGLGEQRQEVVGFKA